MIQAPRPRLTIGIPTYNFGRFIGETLDSFIDGLPAGVEILVVDGASTDDTADVVAARQARCEALRYIRLPARGGIDADVAKTVDMARGDYVWLFSADDVAMKGAVGKVLGLIADEPDVVIVAHAGCTIDMTVIQDRYPILDCADFDLIVGDAPTRARFFGHALTSEAFFSFLSGLVVRREAWTSAGIPPDFFFGSCWAHAARLLAIMQSRGLRVRVQTKPLLYRRGENDSFLTNGVVARIALAIEGWHRIFAENFGSDAPEMTQLKRVMRNEFRLKAFLMAKLSHGAAADQRDWLRRQFDMIYGPSAGDRMSRALLWYLPASAIRALAKVKGVWTRLRQ